MFVSPGDLLYLEAGRLQPTQNYRNNNNEVNYRLGLKHSLVWLLSLYEEISTVEHIWARQSHLVHHSLEDKQTPSESVAALCTESYKEWNIGESDLVCEGS